MTSIIERACRALCLQHGIDPDKQVGTDAGGWAAQWTEFVPDVRTTLEAIREPTDAMHDAGADLIERGEGNRPDRPLPTLRNAFTAMIDAVLAEDGW